MEHVRHPSAFRVSTARTAPTAAGPMRNPRRDPLSLPAHHRAAGGRDAAAAARGEDGLSKKLMVNALSFAMGSVLLLLLREAGPTAAPRCSST
jgi:hypothetical protein